MGGGAAGGVAGAAAGVAAEGLTTAGDVIGKDGILYRASASPQPTTPTPRHANSARGGGGGMRGRPATAFAERLATVPSESATSPYAIQAADVVDRLGPAYVEARALLLSYEQRLRTRRDAAAFVFAAAADGGEGERMSEMRLQWIEAMGGAFWAFFDPSSAQSRVEAADGSDEGVGGANGAAAQPRPPTELIATQRASLDELIAEAEALYPGYSERLQQILYDGHVLFARPLRVPAPPPHPSTALGAGRRPQPRPLLEGGAARSSATPAPPQSAPGGAARGAAAWG